MECGDGLNTHHTHADTVDKVDPDELARSAAAITALAWYIAEMPARLGHATEPQADTP